jgi:four helix bundle protein
VRSEEFGQPLRHKSLNFAQRIVRLSRYLKETHQEYTLARQILRSGTAIGALIAEGKYAESKADLLHKLTIVLKEASETSYWLTLLHHSEYLNDKMFDDIGKDLDELIRLLVASTKTLKNQTKNR